MDDKTIRSYGEQALRDEAQAILDQIALLDDNFEKALRIANQKHDLVALQVYDQRETQLPSIGLVKFKDAESGQFQWVDTSKRSVQESYHQWWIERDQQIQTIFAKSGVDSVKVRTDEDYVRSLITLFKKRIAFGASAKLTAMAIL